MAPRVLPRPLPPERLRLRGARPDEARSLTGLARRSKASWGYDAALMAAFSAELTYRAEDLARLTFVVAEREAPVGFYALAPRADGELELEAMFVDPAHLRRGIGRRLLDDARVRAARMGARELHVQSDPHAAGFYERAGGTPVGTRASASVPGRALPAFVFALRARGAAGSGSANGPSG